MISNHVKLTCFVGGLVGFVAVYFLWNRRKRNGKPKREDRERSNVDENKKESLSIQVNEQLAVKPKASHSTDHKKADDKNTTENQEITSNNLKNKAENLEITSDNQENITKNQENNTDNQKNTTDNQENTTDNQINTTDNQENTTDNQENTTDIQENTPDNQKNTHNQENTTDNQKNTTDNQENTIDIQKNTTGNQENNTHNQENTTDNQENTTDIQENNTHNQENTTDNQENTTDSQENNQHQETSTCKLLPTPTMCSTTDKMAEVRKEMEKKMNDKETKNIYSASNEPRWSGDCSEEIDKSSRLSSPRKKIELHSQKSKIPHIFQKSSTKSTIDQINSSRDKDRTNIPTARRLYETKHDRHHVTGVQHNFPKHSKSREAGDNRMASSNEELKRKYKSLFRPQTADRDKVVYSLEGHSWRQSKNKSDDSLSAVDAFQNFDVSRNVEVSKISDKQFLNVNEIPNVKTFTKVEPLITDEDGSNLLEESGFYDNDLNPENPSENLKVILRSDLSECQDSLSTTELPGSVRCQHADDHWNDERSIHVEEEPLSGCDAMMLKDVEEELRINVAIQSEDVKTLLEFTCKNTSLHMKLRVFQSLAELSAKTNYHSLYSQYLMTIFAHLDFESDHLKVEVLKVLLNLSKNSILVPNLLLTKAPANILKLFLLDVDEDILLIWLALAINLLQYVRDNKTHFAPEVLAATGPNSGETVCDILCGPRSSRVIKSRVYILTRHKNRHITHVARQIHCEMSRKDTK